MQQQIASVCGACGSTLLAYAAHEVATWQRRRHIRQQIASVCAAYSSTLLAQTVLAVAKTKGYTQRKDWNNIYIWSWLAQTVHAVALCQRMRLQIASIDSACGSTLLAYAAHAQQIASVDGIYGSNLLAYMAHAVAKLFKIECFASVDSACGSTLLAYVSHAVALRQGRRRIWQQLASVDGACGS